MTKLLSCLATLVILSGCRPNASGDAINHPQPSQAETVLDRCLERERTICQDREMSLDDCYEIRDTCNGLRTSYHQEKQQQQDQPTTGQILLKGLSKAMKPEDKPVQNDSGPITCSLIGNMLTCSDGSSCIAFRRMTSCHN